MTVDSPPLPPPEATNLPIVADPPPPYPARNRRTRRQRTARRQGNASEPGPPGHQSQNGDVLGSPTSQRTGTFAADDSPQQSFLQPHYTRAGDGGDSSDYDEDRNILLSSPRISMRASQDTYDREDDDMNNHASETTPFLTPPQRPGRRYTGPSGIPTITTTPSGQRLIRRSSISRASTISVAPSLAQTVMSLFNTDDDCEDDFACRDDITGSPSSGYGPSWNRNENGNAGVGVGGRGDFDFDGGQEDAWGDRATIGRPKGLFNKERWRRYFRPLGKKVYYWSLFHLAVVNFPYALAAWVYLFVFTVAGTTLLMALPLGALLCFFNLLGARAFARGELALQTKFHSPLSYPAPYPPRPIFTRQREATSAEVEMGNAAAGDWVPEKSFYRNAYAMFTDPTSYQALFYFLVIKPAITLVFSLALVLFVIPSMVLILPAPAALRAVRRLGVWQANVSVEGLYLAVR